VKRTLYELWRDHITIDDYERHMAAIGQAQANASLLEEFFRQHAPRTGARILFAGAGAGQCFDYVPPTILGAYRVTFTDINPAYLDRLSQRLRGIDFSTVVDDIESPRLPGPYDLAVVILVLEHVDWRKAIAALQRQATRLFLVIQQNPANLTARPLEGSMSALEDSPPVLLDPASLLAALPASDIRTAERTLPDGKRMLAFDITVATALP
jgi:hypothetical protein